MWWLIPAVVGAAGAIWAYFDNEACEARERWEQDRERVASALEEQRRLVEWHLADARARVEFRQFVDLHFASQRAADAAYALLEDARLSLDRMGKMIVEARRKRDELEEEIQRTRDHSRRRALVEAQRVVRELRKKVFDDKDAVKAQRDELLAEVQRLNAQTRALKLAIRDRCGERGRDWYARLEGRRELHRLLGG